MAKVLKTNVSKTIIGLDNGSIEEVDTASLDFIPQVDEFIKLAMKLLLENVIKSNFIIMVEE